jgi:hypothetical protein
LAATFTAVPYGIRFPPALTLVVAFIGLILRAAATACLGMGSGLHDRSPPSLGFAMRRPLAARLGVTFRLHRDSPLRRPIPDGWRRYPERRPPAFALLFVFMGPSPSVFYSASQCGARLPPALALLFVFIVFSTSLVAYGVRRPPALALVRFFISLPPFRSVH